MDPLAVPACDALARTLYPGRGVHVLETQGGCSYTLLVHAPSSHDGDGDVRAAGGGALVLQFRPRRFGVSVDGVQAAREVHGCLVPAMMGLGVLRFSGVERSDGLGEWRPAPSLMRDAFEGSGGDEDVEEKSNNWDRELLVYMMDMLPGVMYSSIQPTTPSITAAELTRVELMVDGLASFFAQSWRSSRLPAPQLQELTGKVAPCVGVRLRKLEKELPTKALRSYAKGVVERVEAGALDLLPKVLTHGDLLPSNLLADEETSQLLAVVDWAEAEVLPFGLALYGVERLLGYIQTPGEMTERRKRRFRADSVHSNCEIPSAKYVYYEDAGKLRVRFYDQLRALVPELEKGEMMEAVDVARAAGVLLWFGFAWDNGNIDRVVNQEDDPLELEMLNVLLDAAGLGFGDQRLSV